MMRLRAIKQLKDLKNKIDVRYLKRFNENKTDLVDYINLCFIDLLDESKARLYFDKEGNYIASIYLNMDYSNSDIFKRYREYYSNCNTLLDRAEECVDKIKIKYPSIKYKLSAIGNIMDIKFYLVE